MKDVDKLSGSFVRIPGGLLCLLNLPICLGIIYILWVTPKYGLFHIMAGIGLFISGFYLKIGWFMLRTGKEFKS